MKTKINTKKLIKLTNSVVRRRKLNDLLESKEDKAEKKRLKSIQKSLAENVMEELKKTCLKTANDGNRICDVMELETGRDYLAYPSMVITTDSLQGIGKIVFDACVENGLTCMVVRFLDTTEKKGGYKLITSW